jgi:acetylornithine deacetylase/succinyl-diaminopimelate desuccinylase-like protein
MAVKIDKTIYRRPAELLQHLIRFNTSNPPGNEKECIHYINRLLKAVGIKADLLFRDPGRPNLVARIKGRGDAAPLLLYGHVDVVPARDEEWQYPPFAGEVAGGFIWGRGALDMKGAVAMMVSAFMRAKIEKSDLPGDVILCIVSDEEEYGKYGARFLVENHADHFEGVRYALSEFGGFTLYVAGKKFYPIEIAQKQKCGIKAIIRGPEGHGSTFVQGSAAARLGQMLSHLYSQHLPVHITPAVQKMFSAMAAALPFPKSTILRLLLNHRFTDRILNLLGEAGRPFVPMFHHTVNPTVIRGGDKLNVIPDRIEVTMDVRLLPGFRPYDVIRELRAIIGDEIKLEPILYDPGPREPDMGLFDTLAAILKEADPEGIPIPLLLTYSSDARFFSKLGIQTYGFIPMQLLEEEYLIGTIHSANERIPVDSPSFGTDAIFQALHRFHD